MCKYCENSSEFELDSDRDLFEGRGLTTKLFIVNEGEDYYLQLVNDLTGEKKNFCGFFGTISLQ